MINFSKVKTFLSILIAMCFISQSAVGQLGLRSTGYLAGIYDVDQAYYQTEGIIGRPILPSTVGSYSAGFGVSFGAELGTEVDVLKKRYGLQMGLGFDVQVGQALNSASGKFRFSDFFVFGRLKYRPKFKLKPFISMRLGIAHHSGDEQYSSHEFEAIQLGIGEEFQKTIYLFDGLYLGTGAGFFIGEKTFIEALFSIRSAERKTDDVSVDLKYSAITVTLGYQFGDW